MRFNRGSIMAPIGSPTKMTGRDQMSIGGLGGGMDFDTSQFLTKSDLPTFDTSQFLTKGDMPTAFDPSQLEQQIGGLQKQIGNIPSYDDTNIRNMIGNIPQFDDSAIRRMIEDNQRSIGNIPSFDPSNLQSGIAGLTDRLDNLNIPEYKAPDLSGFARIDDLPKFNPKDYRDDFLSIAREGIEMPEYKAPDLSGFARKEDIPSFDRNALRDELFKDITGSIKVPEAPIFDRDALIRDIRGGIDIPKPPSFDRDALIEDIRGGINIPSFDREKLIEDIRGGINIPQAPDLSAFDTRFADMQKRIDELSQRQAPQPSIPSVTPQPLDKFGFQQGIPSVPSVEPIIGQPLVPGSAVPTPQTGLGAAELLELSDEELKRYIPRENIGYGVGANSRSIDTTPSPEEFRERLQREMNPNSDDLKMQLAGPRLYRPVDSKPSQTGGRRKGLGLTAVPGIGGMGGGNEGTYRSMDFRDTDMNGVDDRDQPDFGGPSQEYRDQQARIKDVFGGGTLGDLPPGLRMKEQPNVGGPAQRPGGPISIRPDLLPPKRDDFMSIGGPGGGLPDPRFDSPTTPPDIGILDPNTRIGNYGLDRDRKFNEVPVNANPAPVQPAPTEPAAVAPTAGADPTQTQMPMGAIDPVLLQQQTSEKLTDPLIRSLYFGTQDSPGFYQQLQQAGSNLIGSDVPLQQTAGLSPLELLARQQAVAGLGGFEPFLQQNRDLVNQAISQSRRAEELQDPYYTQAEEIYKDTMGAYDPSMTQQFYNPYEDAVVQKTIQDVMEAGDKQDIASRAREISSGAFGGSRARLGAEERRESLGEGLAQALGNIRSQGFQSAQATGLGEFARQQAAKRTGAEGLMGIGIGRGSAASQLGSQLAGYGSQIGGIGSTQEGLRAGQRGELSGYGGIGRGIAETGLGRIFEQQVGQQYRPMQTLGQIASMLPGYQASQTQIDSGYGMPTDPSAAGLGAAFSAYGALAPRQGQT